MEIFHKIDHIGIAVPNLEDAIRWYEKSYGVKAILREQLEPQQTELAFLDLPGSTVELLAPLSPQSKIAGFLEKKGAGLHHICYEVSNLDNLLKELATKGFTLIDQNPRAGARNSRIAFLHPHSCHGVLTELCEYPVTPTHC